MQIKAWLASQRCGRACMFPKRVNRNALAEETGKGRAPECGRYSLTGTLPRRETSAALSLVRMRTTHLDPVADVDSPHPLLSTNEHADFARNFREMEKYAKRPYSLMRVLRSFCTSPPSLDGFEMEVHQELMNLSKGRNVTGRLVPIEALSSWRRDLTIPGLPVVQTTVADEILPFLRAKTVCGRLGCPPQKIRSHDFGQSRKRFVA